MTNDGGPAFPIPQEQAYRALNGHWVPAGPSTPGMTLRDYFAGRVVGRIFDEWRFGGPMSEPEQEGETQDIWMFKAATQAYAFADAMLAAREVLPDLPTAEELLRDIEKLGDWDHGSEPHDPAVCLTTAGIICPWHPKPEPRSYDCGSGTNCGRDYCVAHGGHGGDS